MDSNAIFLFKSIQKGRSDPNVDTTLKNSLRILFQSFPLLDRKCCRFQLKKSSETEDHTLLPQGFSTTTLDQTSTRLLAESLRHQLRRSAIQCKLVCSSYFSPTLNCEQNSRTNGKLKVYPSNRKLLPGYLWLTLKPRIPWLGSTYSRFLRRNPTHLFSLRMQISLSFKYFSLSQIQPYLSNFTQKTFGGNVWHQSFTYLLHTTYNRESLRAL